MTEPNLDHFEMRRLESLSNIFAVAMTLLAYDLPKAGQFKNLPTWTGPISISSMARGCRGSFSASSSRDILVQPPQPAGPAA